MSQRPSAAERLDRAVDAVLEGQQPSVAAATAGVEGTGRPLIEVAAQLHAALVAPPPAARFEGRLGARLADTAERHDPIAWARRHPGRLIVTGAVGSAVGVGVTAYAVWRSSRRANTHRLLHR